VPSPVSHRNTPMTTMDRTASDGGENGDAAASSGGAQAPSDGQNTPSDAPEAQEPPQTRRVVDWNPGEKITAYLALRGKQLRERDGRSFARFEFADRTGRIMAVVSDDLDAVWAAAEINDVVKLRATVGTWNGKKTLHVHRMRRAVEGEYDPAAFLPVYAGDSEQLWDEFIAMVGTIRSDGLRAVAERVVPERARVMAAPGGKLWHHVYSGGLLEHTNSVASLVDHACARYPLADRDLAVAGALLHDIGKISAFNVSTTIEYSDAGRLYGHPSLGERMVRSWCVELSGLDHDTAEHLCHIVLAHQQSGDHPSPVEPMTIEATLVASANEMDATASAFTRIIEREREGGQDWSSWVNTLKRQVHLRPYR
jgi:3'-5' exoribonuclease